VKKANTKKRQNREYYSIRGKKEVTAY